MFKKIKKCRICSSVSFKLCLDLGEMYFTGIFPKSKSIKIKKAPIQLVRCDKKKNINNCGLVQLRHTYDHNYMYGDNYGYRSGLNQSMVTHLKHIVDDIEKKIKLESKDVVLDIGSNDGTTLSLYKKNLNLYGIDPTIKKFKKFYKKKIKTFSGFFSKNNFMKLSKGKKAKVITSLAMFYDLDDPINFAKDIYDCLEDNGIWVFEQSYLPLMIETNSFDTICHEHLSYYSIKQIKYILERSNFVIDDININDVNGGSFRITAKKKKNINSATQLKKIKKFILNEKKFHFHKQSFWLKFKKNIDSERKKLKKFIEKNKSKKICFIGASTKGNVLLQYYKIDFNDIKYIGEVNKDKFNKYTPGTKIKIINEKHLLQKYDYFIVLPWHFKKFFLNSKSFKNKNLVFPLPKFKIQKV